LTPFLVSPSLVAELPDCVLLMMVGTQDTAFPYLLHNCFPRIRSPYQPAHVHFLKGGVKMVKGQHIWVGYFTTFPAAFLRLHVLIKEFAIPDFSLPVTGSVNSFVGEVIVFVPSLFIKGHMREV
jgi:hypothetical protein